MTGDARSPPPDGASAHEDLAFPVTPTRGNRSLKLHTQNQDRSPRKDEGAAFNAYRTRLGAAKIAEAVARFTRAPAKFAATWREADRW